MVSNIFYFHPYSGKCSNLTNIFQMGWNHQLVVERGPPSAPTVTMDKIGPLKIARYCPLVIQGFSNFLGLFQVIMANPVKKGTTLSRWPKMLFFWWKWEVGEFLYHSRFSSFAFIPEIGERLPYKVKKPVFSMTVNLLIFTPYTPDWSKKKVAGHISKMVSSLDPF